MARAEAELKGLVVETSAIHSKIHSKKIKYTVQSKAILSTIATSKLEQIWKSDVVLYPESYHMVVSEFGNRIFEALKYDVSNKNLISTVHA